MKKVAFFNSLNFWGGGEKLHFEYALEFKQKDYDVFVYCKKDAPLWNAARKAGLKTIQVNVSALSFLNIFKIFLLGFSFRKNNIDTVIFSSSQDMKMATATGKLFQIEKIVYLRGLAVPIKNSLINRLFLKSWITHLVPNSKETLKCMFQNINNKAIKANVKVIYHGIKTQQQSIIDEEFIKEIKSKTHGAILGNAGRLTEQKGQLFLLDVAYTLKNRGVDFTLLIAGTGELEEELRAKIAHLKLEKHVILLGFVMDMNSFMASIDIFLLSSYWEGFGYVIVEAMNLAKPVVAFDSSSNPEIVQNNLSGFLIPPDNIEEFSNSTQKLITDAKLRSKMGAFAKEDIRSKFELSDRISEFEEFLNN